MSQFDVERAFGIAVEHYRAGRLEQAESLFRQILVHRPQHVDVLRFLGLIAQQSGNFGNAADLFRQVVALRPDYAEAFNNLGVACKCNGQLEEAIRAYRQAIALKSDYGGAYSNLGNALREMGELDEAIVAYRRAVALKPDFAPAFSNLGNALKETGQLDEAVAACRAAIALKPDFFEAYGNLGNALMDQGQFDEAIAAYRQAMRLKPNDAKPHSDVVYSLYFHPGYDERAIQLELAQWNRQHAESLARFIRPHANDRDPERRLRIGYISPDFRDHVVGRNMLPLLAAHDRKQFEIACYAIMVRHDAMTGQFQALADIWRDVGAESDEQIAQIIREDRIDMLVDLTLHMQGNRLLVLARKPAPVQVTFAGYPGSTGLKTIDYRLTDPFLDLPGMDESIYSERSVRLADSFWCYDPRSDLAVNDLPASRQGFITFGCLNNYCKVNDAVLKLWAAVLGRVENSRLLILSPAGSHRDHAIAILAARGGDPSRVQWLDRRPRLQYLQMYHRLDICLDTFPYNGHTTSLDAMWMGVPVITRIGPTVVGRAGWSQLSNLNLTELAARTDEQFVTIAANLAADIPRLAELRRTLRQRMQQSPLMDGARFARNVEAAYRQMWRTWCGAAAARL
jgi:protein O-GlcNAc transferase